MVSIVIFSFKLFRSNMSVALFIVEDDKSFGETIPIASQRYFTDVWLKVAEQLKLKLIPLFECGADFDQTDIPVILDELDSLQQACQKRFDPSEHIFQRIGLLRETLMELKKRGEIHLFIG